MKPLLLLLMLIPISGCATASRVQREEWKRQINADHDASLRSGNPIDAAFNTREARDANVERECGMPVEKMRTQSEEVRKACMTKLNDSWREHMNMRYFAANFPEVELKCSASPQECKTEFENWTRDSHNANVEKHRADSLARVEADYQINAELERAAQMRYMGAAAGNLSQQMQGSKPINCQTTAFGNALNTSCK